MPKCNPNVPARRTGAVLLIAAVVLGAALRSKAAAPDLPAQTGAAILNHLNAAIGWYRQVASIDQTAGKPSDALFLENARSLALQALRLAFESAKAEAALITEAPAGGGQGAGSNSQALPEQKNLSTAATNVATQISRTQSQITALNLQIQRSGASQRARLTSKRDALQGDLKLENALQDVIKKLSIFAAASESGSTGLEKKIRDLEQSLPALAVTTSAHGAKPAAAVTSPAPKNSTRSGLIAQASFVISEMRSMRDIDHLLDETSHVQQAASQLRNPLLEKLKATIQDGRDAVNQSTASGALQTDAARRHLDALTAQFKQLSDATLPLTQEIILLRQCRSSLQAWRSSIRKEYTGVLESLLVRVFAILIGLALVLLLSSLWRRATFRYVHEARRRRQLLALRRAVTGFLMAVVIILGFVSEFSSLATYAGLLTAGVAVALQAVILSVAAYFFLIGRYGVRIGDRITVAGVTGDVVDIGLVRLYLMELAGTGIDLYPTGRLVAFSNSVLFQTTTPLFKQIPGTAYAWHEVAAKLAAGASYSMAEDKVLEVVNSVYVHYKEALERDHNSVEHLMDSQIPAPSPRAQLQFVDGGIELLVRYPVEIRRASEIDNQVTRKLMEMMNTDPELKASVGSIQIRSAIKA